MISLERLRHEIGKISAEHHIGACQLCDSPGPLIETPSQTLYDQSGKDLMFEKDRNAPLFLCSLCSKDYTDMMDSQWADYYSGRL